MRVVLAVVMVCAGVGCSFDEGPLSFGGPDDDAGSPGQGSGGDGAGGQPGAGAGAGAAGGSDASGSDAAVPEDGGSDPGTDAGVDAGVDAGMDAGFEDAGMDAGFDAGPDAGDAGDDAGPDAGDDAGPDAGTDSSVPEVCAPFSSEDCYTGPVDTEDVGPCHAGTRSCNAEGTAWGDCEGEVLPATAACGEDEDLDCNDVPDDEQGVDDDGDGWDTCGGDCCDDDEDCDAPALVNPGAYDFDGDGVDDDCSGLADDAESCDDSLASDSSDTLDYARALGLCSETTASPPLEERRWGVLSAGFSLTTGSGDPGASQRSIRPDFGAIAVQEGASMLVMSSGTAAAVGDASPAYNPPQDGTDQGTTSTAPDDWLSANGGEQPITEGCPAPPDPDIYDPIMLTLSVRVPTNASAFTLRAYYLTADYAEWVCSFYSDYFVTLLDSSWASSPANPADGNLATYFAAPDEPHPISSNLPYVDDGVFEQCVDGPTGCLPSAVAGTTSSCSGVADLAGTGMDLPDPGSCDASALIGGGTGWLLVGGNVVPGETIQLRLAIWDNTDALWDSHVLLDAFSWHPEPLTPGTVIAD